MSTEITAGPLNLAACRAEIERAHTEVGEICRRTGSGRWRMSIPARPDRDSDLILSAGLSCGALLADEVERLRAERDALKAELAAAVLILRSFENFSPCDTSEDAPHCRTHGWEDDDTCPFKRADLFLAALDASQRPEDTREDYPTLMDRALSPVAREVHVEFEDDDASEDARTGVSAEGDGQ